MSQELDKLIRILRERETLVSPDLAEAAWTAIPPSEGAKGGLELRCGVHEWASRRPPVGFLAACCAANLGRHPGCLVWIGFEPRAVGYALARLGGPPGPGAGDGRVLERSLFVIPPDDGARLWAIDLALRSPGAAMVLADGRGLGVRETRRLQLAAEAGLRGEGGAEGVRGRGGGIALLARRWEERAEPSAAMTRWLIEPAPTPGRRARWRLELVRRKSSHPAISPACWFVEWDREKGAVVVPADVAGGPGAPARVEAEQYGDERPPLRRTG